MGALLLNRSKSKCGSRPLDGDVCLSGKLEQVEISVSGALKPQRTHLTRFHRIRKRSCALPATENWLRQREAASVFEDWEKFVEFRTGVAASESDANRMKELFAFLSSLSLCRWPQFPSNREEARGRALPTPPPTRESHLQPWPQTTHA